MTGNTTGQQFSVTTFGESHGPAIGAVIDGCPPSIPITEELIQVDLDRRKPGRNAHTTLRQEDDRVEVLSGVFEGVTTGTPIALLIRNKDQRSADYSDIKDKFRPGHADFSYTEKYRVRDYRGGGRASARETAARVAAGAIAKLWLNHTFKAKINACVTQVGPVVAEKQVWSQVENNDFFFADPDKIDDLEQLLTDLRSQGDSVGAVITLRCRKIPAGLGEPVFSKLDADLAGAMMSINATKAVSIGAGFDAATARGSDFRDEMGASGFASNNAGGILGGISSGQDIELNVAFKPTSSIATPGKTVDKDGQEVAISVQGRHDPCVALRAVAIVEAMAAIVLMDHALRDRGQIGAQR